MTRRLAITPQTPMCRIPAKPIPYRIRPLRPAAALDSTWARWLVDDQRPFSDRTDVLVYRTAPLTEPVTIAGAPVVNLVAATSGTDGDFVVKLIDVYPDEDADQPPMGGYQLAVAMDILRGRYREGFEKAVAIEAGATLPYRFALPHVSHVFLPGHRIMVAGPVEFGFRCMTAIRKRLYRISSMPGWRITARPPSRCCHDRERSSFVELPVVARKQMSGLSDAFARDGAVILRGILTSAEVQTLRAGIDDNLAHPSANAKTASQADDPGQFVEDFCNWQVNGHYREIIFRSRLPSVAAELMGSRTVRLHHDHMLTKQPATRQKTPWHQDQPYYNIEGRQNVSLWIPVDPGAAGIDLGAGRRVSPRALADASLVHGQRGEVVSGRQPRGSTGYRRGSLCPSNTGLGGRAGGCGGVPHAHSAWVDGIGRPAPGVFGAVYRR